MSPPALRLWPLFALCALCLPAPSRAAAPPPDPLSAAWADLGGSDAAKAYEAICALADRPRDAVPFLHARLKQVKGEDGKRLAKLITDLGADDFELRQTAEKELAKLGERAEPALLDALKGKPSAEVRTRIEGLLGKLTGGLSRPESLRAVRAVEALERVDTPEARKLLDELAQGPAVDRVTMEAREARDRLKRKHEKR